MARRKRNSARVNLILAFVLHALFACAIFFFAAREGVLGKKLKEIAVVIVPKEKPPELPKPKPPEPKIEPPKEEPPKVAQAPKLAAPAPPTAAAPPPQAAASAAPAPAAPPAALPADFSFSDGAKAVETSTNAPVAYYKNFIEFVLRSNWNRPEDIEDDSLAAEVEVEVDADGKLVGYSWSKRSGNSRWDESVAAALAGTKVIGRVPPKGFPPKFTVRFDILSATEPLLLQ